MPDNIKCENFGEQNVTTLAVNFPLNGKNVMLLACINNSLPPHDSLPSSSNLPNVRETTNACPTQFVCNKNYPNVKVNKNVRILVNYCPYVNLPSLLPNENMYTKTNAFESPFSTFQLAHSVPSHDNPQCNSSWVYRVTLNSPVGFYYTFSQF